jgi:hypothetical protein
MISNLTGLILLDLCENQLDDAIPESFMALENILFLNLRENILSGPITTHVAFLGNLKKLYLSQMQYVL